MSIKMSSNIEAVVWSRRFWECPHGAFICCNCLYAALCATVVCASYAACLNSCLTLLLWLLPGAMCCAWSKSLAWAQVQSSGNRIQYQACGAHDYKTHYQTAALRRAIYCSILLCCLLVAKSAVILQAACLGYFTDNGVVTEREWTNPYQNYDNVGRALLSLFVAVTLNGYSRKLFRDTIMFDSAH